MTTYISHDSDPRRQPLNPRYRISSARIQLVSVSTIHARLWIAQPIPTPGEPATYIPYVFGRRVIELPKGSAVAATWREAITYATTGAKPRNIADLYPTWCGL